MESSFFTIDQKDINVINAVASLYLTYATPFVAKDLLALSYEIDASNPQTIRLLCIAYIKCGDPKAAHVILEKYEQNNLLSPIHKFIYKLTGLKLDTIQKDLNKQIKALR